MKQWGQSTHQTETISRNNGEDWCINNAHIRIDIPQIALNNINSNKWTFLQFIIPKML